MKLERFRTTWVRWDPKRHNFVTSHPWLWIWIDDEGTERTFKTKREALEAQKALS